jgi:hypothetical protein
MVGPRLRERVAEHIHRIRRSALRHRRFVLGAGKVQEAPDLAEAERLRRHDERRDASVQLRRLDRVRHERDRRVVRHRAVLPRGPRRPPVHDQRPPSECLGDVPQRGRAARAAVDGPLRRAIDEVDQAVAIGGEPGRERRPHEGRHRRLDRLQRCRRAALREGADVRDASIVRELGDQLPVRAVDGENCHAAGDAARVAAQFLPFVLEERAAVGLHVRDLERRHFQTAAREMSGDHAAQVIAAHRELRGGGEQLLDRHLLGHGRHRLGDARPDPRAPAVAHQASRVGQLLAGEDEAQPVTEHDRHAFLRPNADQPVALRGAVPLLETEAVELMRRQVRDPVLHQPHLSGALVDAEDQLA